MKVIQLKDIEQVAPEDVKVGYIIAEGVIVGIDTQQARSAKGTEVTTYFYTTAGGGSAYTDSNHKVEVIGRLHNSLTSALLERIAEVAGR